MRDKFRFATLITAGMLMVLMTAQCSVYHKIFPKKSAYFTDAEIQLLSRTTGAIDFDYGYDVETGLDYVYYYSYKEKDLPGKRKRMASALKGIDPEKLTAFYEKIYSLKIVTLVKMEEYRSREKWKNYTYVRKYLQPPLDVYTDLLEKETLKRNKNYKGVIESRKAGIEKEYDYTGEKPKINKEK